MKKRILIVEDEPSLLFALQDYLDQQGYDVSVAAELEEASALLMNLPFDVVITDLRLTPVQAAEGLHVIELVRDRSLDSRIIMLTGSATAAIERSVRNLGVDCYLRKPVPLAVIARSVSELVASS